MSLRQRCQPRRATKTKPTSSIVSRTLNSPFSRAATLGEIPFCAWISQMSWVC